MTLAASPQQEPAPVVILGATDSGGQELYQHLIEEHTSPFEPARIPLRYSDRNASNPPCVPPVYSVPVWCLNASHDDEEAADKQAKELAACLRQFTVAGGREFMIGGCPFFVVLTHCDQLAQPNDRRCDWLERIASRKSEVAERLAALFPAAQNSRFPGFGSVTWHIRAIAIRMPRLAEPNDGSASPFGVDDLARETVVAAIDITDRQARQPHRLRAVIRSTLALLVGMLALTVWMAGNALLTRPSVSDAAQSAALRQQWLDHHGQVMDLAGKLLHFDEYRSGSPPTSDWPRWDRDAAKAGRAAAELQAQAATHGGRLEETAELLGAIDKLQILRDRAALLGLSRENESKPPIFALVVPPGDALPLAQFRNSCQQRLQELRQFYSRYSLGPPALPEETPMGVQRELQRTARAEYERLLDPVRTDLLDRVRIKGNGQETPAAWRGLANGYLAHEARTDWAAWQELAVLLLRLSGQEEAHEPLEELAAFLRRDKFELPLATVTLQLPTVAKDAESHQITELRPRVENPLTIWLRPPKGDEITLRLVFSLPPMPVSAEATRFRFVAMQPNALSDGRLTFRPGDAVSASLQVFDKDGHAWQLSWPLAESPSAVYSFAVLTEPPRLHRADEADASRGRIAFGIKLLFSEPDRMRLPDLMPR